VNCLYIEKIICLTIKNESIMSSLSHLGVHLIHNKAVKGVVTTAATAAAGTAVGSAGVAAGSALSAVGATSIGGAVTSAGTTLLSTAAGALGGGATATSVIGTIGAGAAFVGTIAPYVAVGCGLYYLGKTIFGK
jgi:hypothetical protein